MTPNKAINNSLVDLHLVNAHLQVSGVDASMPVEKQTGELAQTGRLAQFVMLDAAKAVDVVTIREDLAPDFDVLMEELLTGRPTMAGVDLPGRPNAIELVFAVEVIEEESDEPFPSREPFELQARVKAIIQDGDGILHRVPLSVLRPGVGPRRMVADLTAPFGVDERATPVYPLRLVNIEIEQQVPNDDNHMVRIEFQGVGVRDSSGWNPVSTDLSASNWTVDRSRVIGAAIAPSINVSPVGADATLGIEIQTGWGFAVAPVHYSIRPAGTVLPETIPVVVSESLLEDGLTKVGDAIRLTPLGISNDLGVIVGTIASFPTVNPDGGETVIVDLATVETMGYEAGFGLARIDEYWLSTEDHPGDVAAELSAPPIRTQTVVSSAEVTDTLVSDPVALGTIGALTVGFAAAAVFAAVGFAVSATVSARERLIEFALLRALGLSPRQLGGWLVLEQSALVIASLAMGTLIGVILTATVLPLIAVTQSGQTAVPEVIVIYPWRSIVTLELAVVALLGVIVAVMALLLRRIGLGSLLRLGDD